MPTLYSGSTREGTADAFHRTARPTWFKIKNASYTRGVGRHELFDGLRAPTPAAQMRWREME